MRILMVCLGNICRSPLAQGILEHKLKQQNITAVVDSAGTGGWHSGEAPDPRSIAIARKHGVDISKQRARKFTAYDFEQFDLIFAMDSSNYNDVLRLSENDGERAKVKLMMNELQPGRNINVPDPYYDSDGFEQVFQMLNAACDKVLERYF